MISIDDTIEEIGRNALESARRLEEAEKRKLKLPRAGSAGIATALTWNAVQRAYSPDPAEYFARAQGPGLQCPIDIFEQLFVDHHDDAEFGTLVGPIDWGAVEWTEKHLSGAALRRIGVPRAYQYAVDEARGRTAQNGFQDERQEVMNHWREAKTWMRSPILLAGDLLQTALQYELIVGTTRLGNLLGALDRQDVPESAQHTVWLGRPL
ncbi:MAG TPA: hypothetical protein VGD63_02085 [Steroidobacteraceae bacterium]